MHVRLSGGPYMATSPFSANVSIEIAPNCARPTTNGRRVTTHAKTRALHAYRSDGCDIGAQTHKRGKAKTGVYTGATRLVWGIRRGLWIPTGAPNSKQAHP